MDRISQEPHGAEHTVPGAAPAVVQRLCRLLLRTLAVVEVRGVTNVPTEGPCLLVFNHVSNFDPPLIFSALPRSDVVALVAAEYRSNLLLRPFIEAAGSVWLQRGASDRAALEKALSALGHGRMVALSPEGGRSATGGLRRAKPGAAFLAVRSGVPILPVAVTNAHALQRSWRRFGRPRVTVTFGPTFRPVVPSDVPRKSAFVEVGDEIMRRVASLLPREYRGVYADAWLGARRLRTPVGEAVPGGGDQ